MLEENVNDSCSTWYVDDEDGEEDEAYAPVIPERTAQSFQFVDGE